MSHSLIKKQYGATLLISLILLLVLTVLALAAGHGATLQQRMAGNQQQQNSAFQTAENGIQAAIVRLQDENSRPLAGSQNKKCLYASADARGIPGWGACGSKKSGNYYYVEVEAKADCGNYTVGMVESCYIITSTGHVDSATAKHQQGYMF